MTKTFISVLSMLSESFTLESLQKLDKKSISTEPFIIQNRTGRRIILIMDDNNQTCIFYHAKGDSDQIENLVIEPDRDVPLNLRFNRKSLGDTRDYISPLKDQSEQSEALLSLRVGSESGVGKEPGRIQIPLNKADIRF